MESQLTNVKEYKIVSLIARLTELHFHDGRNGWTPDMIKWHQKLAWRLNILVEEVQGLALCTISMHNLLHIHEDIMNFSASDNVWCAGYDTAEGVCKEVSQWKKHRSYICPCRVNKKVLKISGGKRTN